MRFFYKPLFQYLAVLFIVSALAAQESSKLPTLPAELRSAYWLKVSDWQADKAISDASLARANAVYKELEAICAKVGATIQRDAKTRDLVCVVIPKEEKK